MASMATWPMQRHDRDRSAQGRRPCVAMQGCERQTGATGKKGGAGLGSPAGGGLTSDDWAGRRRPRGGAGRLGGAPFLHSSFPGVGLLAAAPGLAVSGEPRRRKRVGEVRHNVGEEL
jgi:hypothetical protein